MKKSLSKEWLSPVFALRKIKLDDCVNFVSISSFGPVLIGYITGSNSA